MVLLAPLILVFLHGWDEWAQGRGYTLAFYLLFRSVTYNTLRDATDVKIDHTKHEHVTAMLQKLSLFTCFLAFVVNNVAMTTIPQLIHMNV